MQTFEEFCGRISVDNPTIKIMDALAQYHEYVANNQTVVRVGEVRVEIDKYPEGYSARVSVNGDYQFNTGGAENVFQLFKFVGASVPNHLNTGV